jgi:hypothetical protein
MGLDSATLISELKTFVAGRGGAHDLALRMLAARTIELAELVQEQGSEIEELKRRVDLQAT